MSQSVELENYESWPTDPVDRSGCAEELFGRHLAAAYDNVLRWMAEMVLGTWHYKQPTKQQQQIYDWLESCSEADRECEFALIQETVELFLAAMLTHLDNATGCVLRERVGEEFRLMVEIRRRLDDGTIVYDEEPLEALPANKRARGYTLHELWPDWQERYSRWYLAPLSELRGAVERTTGDAARGVAEEDEDEKRN